MTLQNLHLSLERSCLRLNKFVSIYNREPTPAALFYLKREAWIHLKRSFKLWASLKLKKG